MAAITLITIKIPLRAPLSGALRGGGFGGAARLRLLVYGVATWRCYGRVRRAAGLPYPVALLPRLRLLRRPLASGV
ncbi:hypothetical protein [Corynebacterium oculi]|uniref:hypothetical protein n=1 Tax=Corynebacterium oculi TaxID=1544416 RepID=UPI001237100A|nr:hypothetical protein [Corynebacterium oculi]